MNHWPCRPCPMGPSFGAGILQRVGTTGNDGARKQSSTKASDGGMFTCENTDVRLGCGHR